MALSFRSKIFPRSSEVSPLTVLTREASDGEGGVVPTEAKAIADYGVDFAINADVGCKVEIEIGIGMVVVDRGGNHPVDDNHCAYHRLDRSCRSEHVARCRFRRAHVDVLRVLPEHRLDRAGLI